MTKIKRPPRELIGYRCPKDLLGKIDALIENNEFERRPEVITAALRFYFENMLTGQQRKYHESWKNAVASNPDFFIDMLIEIKKGMEQKKQEGGKEK